MWRKVWLVSIRGEENRSASLVMVCGVSSLFVHSTAAPFRTDNSLGEKEKLPMAAATTTPAAAPVAGELPAWEFVAEAAAAAAWRRMPLTSAGRAPDRVASTTARWRSP